MSLSQGKIVQTIIYCNTSHTGLFSGVQAGFASQYLELVRRVGVELRSLLSSVDTLVAVFPPNAHREVRKCVIHRYS
jgi:hypothetical protein